MAKLLFGRQAVGWEVVVSYDSVPLYIQATLADGSKVLLVSLQDEQVDGTDVWRFLAAQLDHDFSSEASVNVRDLLAHSPQLWHVDAIKDEWTPTQLDEFDASELPDEGYMLEV